MINLMPPEAKQNILYGRRNRVLVRSTVTCFVTIALMAAVVLFGMFYIDSSKTALAESIAKTKQEITDQKLDQTQKQAVEMSQGLKLIIKILSQEVSFSKLLKQIGKVMPSGTSLTSIQLSNTVDGALDLTAGATDYQSATQVQVNLLDPDNNLFSKVDTISVGCGTTSSSSSDSSGGASKYPCQIILRAQFKPGAAITFLANPATTGAQ